MRLGSAGKSSSPDEHKGDWELTFNSPDMYRLERLNPDDRSINQSVIVRDRSGEVSALVYYEPEREAVTITDVRSHIEWFICNNEGRLYVKQNGIQVAPETYISAYLGSTSFEVEANNTVVTIFGSDDGGPFKAKFDYVNVFNIDTERHVGMWVESGSN